MRPPNPAVSPLTRPASVARWTGWAFLTALIVLTSAAYAQAPRPLSVLPSAAVTPTSFALTGGSVRSTPRSTPRTPRSANPHGDIAIACEACHTAEGWRPLRDDPDFDHRRDTGFGLEARHAQASCASCHLGLRFTGLDDLGDTCQTCHVDVHRGALGEACASCHESADWALVDGVEVHAQTAFPLTGSHLQVSCESCHTAGADAAAFSPLPADCLGCHEADLASTEASLVPHVASGFPTDCETCHTTVAWSAGPFDHAGASGGFSLVGAHDALACSSCHVPGPDFQTLWTPAGQDDCLSCHEADRASATIDHSGFPDTCTECHTVAAWEGATADHVLLSGGFALVGAHLSLDCSSCHAPDLTPIWDPASQNDCYTCHQDDYEATANGIVDHVAGGFPTTCTECHGVDQWQSASFDHASVSGGFNLVGAHDLLACATCHSGPGGSLPWDPASQNDCVSCHASDAASATPSHASFPETCATCHGVDQWPGATVDHVSLSGGFALVGAHLTLDCATCHSGSGGEVPWDPATQDDCVSCHQQDAATATPDHTSFPETCTACHGVSQWQGATVDHAAISGGFELVGAHVEADCATCHSGPGGSVPWDPASQNDCVSCHAQDAASATPSHDSFPETCTACHSTTQWQGATVDHVAISGGFALVGAHISIDCAACHSGPGGEVPWTPSSQDDCVSCHADDAAAAQPDHTGFPTTCTQCHSATQWQGATVDHPQFPIFSGDHAGEWDTCQTCHVQPSNYEVFSCLNCHEHRQSRMDDEHDDVGGYVYESTACYSCHPDGRADDDFR